MEPAVFRSSVLSTFEVAYVEEINKPTYRQISSIAGEYEAPHGSAEYPFWGDVLEAEEFTGVVDFVDLKDEDYFLKNKEWYTPGTLFRRTDVERDRVNTAPSKVRSQLRAIMNVPFRQLGKLLMAGTEMKAYDDVPLFSNATGNRNFDNLLDGTGTTLQAVINDIDMVRAAMIMFPSDTGNILELVPDTVVCPIKMESTFLQIKNSTASPVAPNSGAANPWATYIDDVIALPSLGDSDDWYFLHTKSSLKPIFWQYERLMAHDEVPSRLVGDNRYRMDFVNSEVGTRRHYAVTCETRGNAGVGLPHFATKVVN